MKLIVWGFFSSLRALWKTSINFAYLSSIDYQIAFHTVLTSRHQTPLNQDHVLSANSTCQRSLALPGKIPRMFSLVCEQNRSSCLPSRSCPTTFTSLSTLFICNLFIQAPSLQSVNEIRGPLSQTLPPSSEARRQWGRKGAIIQDSVRNISQTNVTHVVIWLKCTQSSSGSELVPDSGVLLYSQGMMVLLA